MPDPTLHPNLAKVAAAYDEIVERASRHQLTPPQARALISQLEARDDDGVRWSIDPDSGRWVRKTAFGDAEYDASPPAYGYRTFDAFDLSPNTEAFNPADRLTYQAVDDSVAAPGSLLGATRRLQAPPASAPRPLDRLRSMSTRSRVLLGAALAVLAVGAWSAATPDEPAGLPAPAIAPAP